MSKRNLIERVQGASDAVLAQAKASSSGIWQAVKEGDITKIQSLLASDPGCLKSRGVVNELPLHILFLHNTPKHQRVAKWILLQPEYKRLINEPYGEGLYEGETCLHIAIVNKDLDMVTFLVENGADYSNKARAIGTFFGPDRLYYGETVAHFAACVGYIDVLEYLLKKGADALCQDRYGNTALHLLVYHSKPRTYDFILAHYRKSAPTVALAERVYLIRNGDGLTPLTMAAQIGNKAMFKHLLQKHKKVEWTYGPVTCCHYALEDIDTASGATGTALELIVSNNHLDLVTLPFVERLLRSKWENFARRHFLAQFFMTLLYLIVFSIAVFLRRPFDGDGVSETDVVRYVCEGVSLVVAVAVAVRELYLFFRFRRHLIQLRKRRAKEEEEEEAKQPVSPVKPVMAPAMRRMSTIAVPASMIAMLSSAQKPSKFLRSERYRDHGGQSMDSLAFYCIFASALLIAVVMRALEQQDGEDTLLAFAAIMGWTGLLYYGRGFQLTGPFVIMILQMLTTDIVRFTAIFAVFLLGFAEAFFLVFQNSVVQNFDGWRGFMGLYAIMLGDFDLRLFEATHFPLLALVLFVLYSAVSTILLLNLLIAMMGNTYQTVWVSAGKQWALQWSKIILSIEQQMTSEQRLSYALGTSDGDDGGSRYLMVEEHAEDKSIHVPSDDVLKEVRHLSRSVHDMRQILKHSMEREVARKELERTKHIEEMCASANKLRRASQSGPVAMQVIHQAFSTTDDGESYVDDVVSAVSGRSSDDDSRPTTRRNSGARGISSPRRRERDREREGEDDSRPTTRRNSGARGISSPGRMTGVRANVSVPPSFVPMVDPADIEAREAACQRKERELEAREEALRSKDVWWMPRGPDQRSPGHPSIIVPPPTNNGPFQVEPTATSLPDPPYRPASSPTSQCLSPAGRVMVSTSPVELTITSPIQQSYWPDLSPKSQSSGGVGGGSSPKLLSPQNYSLQREKSAGHEGELLPGPVTSGSPKLLSPKNYSPKAVDLDTELLPGSPLSSPNLENLGEQQLESVLLGTATEWQPGFDEGDRSGLAMRIRLPGSRPMRPAY